ncbi:NAD-dependent epimerase/dehydratase family protein [Spirosoma luteum]|uniref:NAD-dependent epimerase/dehydratase family protein n=1 Tax=Spirosoma luteum TaxID=431553 RepID=UPI00035D3FCB|nr:NAD-dependent epimerase/dehydratase family protein [Spirosoma luteum]
MLVGDGMIARRFRAYADRNDVVLFASGVSNSKETRPEPYARERHLVEDTLRQAPGCLFVYFSTASIADPIEQGSPYVMHKMALEELIKEQASAYLIIRASNVVGGPGNPHTILNFFVDRIRRQESFTIWQHAVRNVIDIDDLYQLVSGCIADASTWNQTLVVANPYSVSPLVIVQAIERHTGQKAKYELLDKGAAFTLPAEMVSKRLPNADDDWQPERYITRLLQKYYV